MINTIRLAYKNQLEAFESIFTYYTYFSLLIFQYLY